MVFRGGKKVFIDFLENFPIWLFICGKTFYGRGSELPSFTVTHMERLPDMDMHKRNDFPYG